MLSISVNDILLLVMHPILQQVFKREFFLETFPGFLNFLTIPTSKVREPRMKKSAQFGPRDWVHRERHFLEYRAYPCRRWCPHSGEELFARRALCVAPVPSVVAAASILPRL